MSIMVAAITPTHRATRYEDCEHAAYHPRRLHRHGAIARVRAGSERQCVPQSKKPAKAGFLKVNQKTELVARARFELATFGL